MSDASSSPRNWRGSAPVRPGAKAASPRRGKIVSVAAVFLFLAGTVAAVVWWFRPVPEAQFVALWVDQYQDQNMPVSAWAAKDRDILRQISWKEKNTFASQEHDLLLAELRGLASKADR